MDNWMVKSTKRLLRHRRSRAFFQNGSWTEDPQAATNFPSVEEVARACITHQLSEMELVLQFEDKLPELSFPIK